MRKISVFYFLTFPTILVHSQTVVLRPDGTTGKDAFVWDYQPNISYGTFAEFSIYGWTYTGTPTIRRAYIDFDWSVIPANATIQSATLTLYNDSLSQSTSGQHQQLSGSNEMYMERIITPWNELTVTWNNQPSVTTANQISIPASTGPYVDYDIDVTTLVQDIIDNPGAGYGFALRLQNENYYRSVIFAGSNHSDSTIRPKLEITYTISAKGISESENDNILVFPNLVTSGISILSQDGKPINSLSVVDLEGKEVMHREVKTSNYQGDFEFLSKGMYLLFILMNDGVVIRKKFIRQ